LLQTEDEVERTGGFCGPVTEGQRHG
jgi:hypothetical protein